MWRKSLVGLGRECGEVSMLKGLGKGMLELVIVIFMEMIGEGSSKVERG